MDLDEAQQLVVTQCGCSAEQARRAVQACGGDVVDALLMVSAEQEAAASAAGVPTAPPVVLTEEDQCVELLVLASQCTEAVAREALRREKGDVVNALLYLSSVEHARPVVGPPPPVPPRKPRVKLGKKGRLAAGPDDETEDTHFFDSLVEEEQQADADADAEPQDADAFAAGLTRTLRDGRLRVAAEMLSSEQSYFHSLFVLRDHYVRHVLLRAAHAPPSLAQLNEVLEALVPCTLHTLQRLEQCVRAWPATSASACFPEPALRDMELLYFQYALSCQAVMADLKTADKDEQLSELLRELKRDAIAGTMEIRSYLIMPVQRLPRYELLMRQLLAATAPAHEDFGALQATLRLLEAANRGVNERMRSHMQAKQMQQLRQRFSIDPGFLDSQVLLKEGNVVKRTSKGLMEKRVLFLFANELAYAKPAFGGALSLSFKAPLRLCRILDLPAERDKWRFELRVTGGKTSHIYLESMEAKMEWMLAITNATAAEISHTPDGAKYRPRPDNAPAPLYKGRSVPK